MNSRVSNVTTKDCPFLDKGQYWHWGDPDHYYANHREYIIVPITSARNDTIHNYYPPIIAIFQASNLRLVAYGELKQRSVSYCGGLSRPQRSVGWCAVNPKTGVLFTSEDFDYTTCFPKVCIGGINNGVRCEDAAGCLGGFCDVPYTCNNQDFHFLYRRELLRYSIPWNSIPKTNDQPPFELTLGTIGPTIPMHDANGNTLELYNMQGGEFSPDGDLLYTSSGSGCCYVGPLGAGFGQQYAIDGLHVFDTTTWRSIKRSYNHDENFPLKNLSKHFDYHYPLGCDGAGSWSPEGLTIWDLDNGRAPGINGQLHVLLFKFRKTGSNRQIFEHFGNRIYVDPSNGIDQPIPVNSGDDAALPGAKPLQFKSFKYAYNGYPAWDGSEIVLKEGRYSAVGKYSTRIRIVSRGGSAVLK